MSGPARAGTYRAALGVPEFDAIAGSSLVSILGDGAAYLAATVLVYQSTGSSLLSSLTFAVAFLPYLFGGTLLAALVDRVRPKALLIGFDLLGAGLIAITAIPGMPIMVLFAVLFVLGSLSPVRSGTAGSLVAEILVGDTFLAGRSVLRICAQSGQIAGTALGGALVAGFGPRGALPRMHRSDSPLKCVDLRGGGARCGRVAAAGLPGFSTDHFFRCGRVGRLVS